MFDSFALRAELLGLVDGAASDYGAQDLGCEVSRRRDFCQIIGQNYEIGELADSELALSSLFELGVGGTECVVADAFVERDFFLGLPAASGAAFRKFARDASVEAAERIDRLDGIVGAEGQTRTAFLQGIPGVSTFDAAGTNAGFGPAHVVGLMRGLHGSDDVELGEAREIFEGDDLGVLDAIAAIAGAVSFGDGFQDVEGDAIGAVADGVEGQLKAGFVALDGHLAKLVGFHDEDARSGRVVRVRREHGRGA